MDGKDLKDFHAFLHTDFGHSIYIVLVLAIVSR